MHVDRPQSYTFAVPEALCPVLVLVMVTVANKHMVAGRRDEGVTSSCYGAQLRA